MQGSLRKHGPLARTASILITFDVDPTPEVTIENKRCALAKTVELLERLGIPATFFFHAKITEKLGDSLACLAQRGHEIGCHGLTHGDEEEYDKMPEDMQRCYLTEATRSLTERAGRPVTSFRGPRVKTSNVTQGILEELGYSADCSVASQRLDFVSSNLVKPAWLLAPRLPYHPSAHSAFRRGDRRIWVVPLSAMIVPLISSALYVVGVGAMKSLLAILHRESLWTGKPIVYLAHPFEFAPFTEPAARRSGSLLRRIRTHGLSLRSRLYEKDHNVRLGANGELLQYARGLPNVEFLTVSAYVRTRLANGEAGTSVRARPQEDRVRPPTTTERSGPPCNR